MNGWDPFPRLFEAFVADWSKRLDLTPHSEEWGEFRDDLAELCKTALDCSQGAFADLMGMR